MPEKYTLESAFASLPHPRYVKAGHGTVAAVAAIITRDIVLSAGQSQATGFLQALPRATFHMGTAQSCARGCPYNIHRAPDRVWRKFWFLINTHFWFFTLVLFLPSNFAANRGNVQRLRSASHKTVSVGNYAVLFPFQFHHQPQIAGTSPLIQFSLARREQSYDITGRI